MEFTASAVFHAKLEHAQELLSHAVPSANLSEIFERGLDALIEKELRRRRGAGRPRKSRALVPGSRQDRKSVV